MPPDSTPPWKPPSPESAHDGGRETPVRTVQQFGAALRSARRHRQMTQADLGLRLGVTQGRVAQLEAQPGALSMDKLLSACSALGLELVLRPRLQPGADKLASGDADW